MEKITFPVHESLELKQYEKLSINGKVLCGRDAVLPHVVACIKAGTLSEKGIDLNGAVIFHTAVSPAGVGPTSSNKLDIESSISALAAAGVKLFLGKGELQKETVECMKSYGAAFAVTPPVTALFNSCIRSSRLIAFEELGMEALYELEVEDFPAIVMYPTA